MAIKTKKDYLAALKKATAKMKKLGIDNIPSFSKRMNNTELDRLLSEAEKAITAAEAGVTEAPATAGTTEIPEGACENYGSIDLTDAECQDCTAQQLCDKHAQEKAAASGTAKKKRTIGEGRTDFGHLKGAISGKIDIAFLETEKGLTYKEVAEMIEATEQRVRLHVEKDLKTGMRTNGIPATIVDMGEGRIRLEVPEALKREKKEETPEESTEEGQAAANA